MSIKANVKSIDSETCASIGIKDKKIVNLTSELNNDYNDGVNARDEIRNSNIELKNTNQSLEILTQAVNLRNPKIKPLRNIAFIGNSLPRRCGLATFTNDIETAVSKLPNATTSIIAMTDNEQSYNYPSKVKFEIQDKNLEEYNLAAEFLNSGEFDLVSLQHEFGIYGGEAGENILYLLEKLTIPIVTTFHTILSHPNKKYFEVMQRVIKVSSRVIVMSQKGAQMLQTIYGVPKDKIEIIAHGIPDLDFIEPEIAKEKLGLKDKKVLLTFGLLSPNKGIEVMIDAMAQIVETCPNVSYIVLGATHPNLVRENGEKYRQSLIKRASDLGVAENVTFIDEFVDLDKLVEYLSACDVYVTPYLNEAQMTSGTLAYSYGLGNAVVSTPYWHAEELLADGKGILVPFGDKDAIGKEISELLNNDDRRNQMRKSAFISGREMIWPSVAQEYMKIFEKAIRAKKQENVRILSQIKPSLLPKTNFKYLMQMCDDTGIMQHAIYGIPDRLHGYCVDDNARGLLLAARLNHANLTPLKNSGTFASFVQHAWNRDTGRFRNFMSFSRNWLEDVGSEDSHGRTLWALGNCAIDGDEPAEKKWAKALLIASYQTVKNFTSPRALAFSLLGITACPIDKEFAKNLGQRLYKLLEKNTSKNWVWFEKGLSYENARLPQALIEVGKLLNIQEYINSGLKALKFLMKVQTSINGDFRPYGTEGFFATGIADSIFDQQPVEAQATISACLSAFKVTNDEYWRIEAERAFDWFFGQNDLNLPLVNLNNGACYDGLHPNRVNENCGAESVLAYLLSLCDMNIFMQILPKQMKKEQIDQYRNLETPRAFTTP